ncbi:dimethylmenaquinone methyltransferase [Petrotoga sp. HKA.pet.4.5]|uniref:RraA family protein n=1 Tax=unclassified Petrotoga TaxID=2620614 RepID=UPI000EF15A0E|nr:MULTISPECIES: RraA family protein [unclassified Petrotoga]RLL82359.1 dimethylmenaquinone methyltransferase [Petrotoga sp. Shatin.DS.tank11.9.2.9.3]RLL90066.1 dimethylmenaquinone methyltransferase [Petrotoga sp. HKA.pet.4.5]
MNDKRLTNSELLQLKRFNTPTIYNGWEAITDHDTTGGHFNLEETTDFMPHMAPIVGYAVTVKIEPSNPEHKKNRKAWQEYREYVASIDGPKIVVIEDLDKPEVIGSFWGEVNSNIHKALGCIGTITDGAIRDVDEMTDVGFKAIARRLCVGHAFVTPVAWNCKVEVFGCPVKPGQLIHADKHGFLVIPEEDEERLLEASLFMDENECNTVITAAKESTGKSKQEILAALSNADKKFSKATEEKFGSKGEW